MSPRTVAALLALGAVLSWGSSPSVATPATTPVAMTALSLVWADEFNGPAGAFQNAAGWTFAIGGGGWGNNELECYTSSRANAATNGNGQLVISALRTPGHVCADGHVNAFTSARITTQKSFTVTHGRLEIRAMLPPGAGAWPAFWALGADQPQVGWPRCGEIDVMEYAGNRPTVTTSAAHISSYLGAHWYTSRISPSSVTLSSRFHVYAVDWTSNSLTFYRDSVVIGVITRAQVLQHGTWPFDKPFYLLLNLAMGGTYAGPVPASVTSPQRYVIDYVRVYH
ncbi:MAG: hydrolase [Marmoricola sp.]|nr:hydrolase [Marmoricola sp.]